MFMKTKKTKKNEIRSEKSISYNFTSMDFFDN